MEDVRDRLDRAVTALRTAGVEHAVVGGAAVAAWVSRVDRAAVRNTRDVDLLLNRSDFQAAKAALESAGFVYRHVKSIDTFLDGPAAKARDAVHILFTGEKVRDSDLAPTPTVTETEEDASFRVVSLESLVKMKLVSYRDKDRTHLRDLIDLELVDESWLPEYPRALADRLKQLIDKPEG